MIEQSIVMGKLSPEYSNFPQKLRKMAAAE
jgi:hypothetical protein